MFILGPTYESFLRNSVGTEGGRTPRVMFCVVAPWEILEELQTFQRVLRSPSSESMSLEGGRDQVEQTELKVKWLAEPRHLI